MGLFCQESSSWVEIRLHTEDQLPRYGGSGVDVLGHSFGPVVTGGSIASCDSIFLHETSSQLPGYPGNGLKVLLVVVWCVTYQ